MEYQVTGFLSKKRQMNSLSVTHRQTPNTAFINIDKDQFVCKDMVCCGKWCFVIALILKMDKTKTIIL